MSDHLKTIVPRVRRVAEGGTINGSYRLPPGEALEAFRADLKILCAAFPGPTIETLLAEREREVREACAKVAEEWQGAGWVERCDDPCGAAATEIAAAIRDSGK